LSLRAYPGYLADHLAATPLALAPSHSGSRRGSCRLTKISRDIHISGVSMGLDWTGTPFFHDHHSAEAPRTWESYSRYKLNCFGICFVYFTSFLKSGYPNDCRWTLPCISPYRAKPVPTKALVRHVSIPCLPLSLFVLLDRISLSRAPEWLHPISPLSS